MIRRFTSGPKPSPRVISYESRKSPAWCEKPYFTPSKRARFAEHSAGAMM